METNINLPGIRHIIQLGKTESTQLAAKALAEHGCEENTVIIAECQTAGYGRLDHKWESAPGGLYMSVLLRPETDPRFFTELSEITANVLAGIFRNEYDIQAKVKLPNDVYVLHKKRKKWLKISGILSEAATVPGEKSDWLIIGIGININNSDFPETAISLKQIIGAKPDILSFAAMFFKKFWPEYYAWECSGRMRST